VDTGQVLVRAIMISAIYSVAVACVVFPKQSWSLARREPGSFRPVGFYVLAGLAAVAITQLMGLGFCCILKRGLGAGVQRYLLTYPWSLLTFTTAVMTGILIDDPPTARRPRLRRALEGLAGAVMMSAGALLTHQWLQEVDKRAAQQPADYQVPWLPRVLVTSAVVGFVIGFLVPHWHRRAPRAPACQAPQTEARCTIGALPAPTAAVAEGSPTGAAPSG
jgi:ABC-type sugar transport system permease subunit